MKDKYPKSKLTEEQKEVFSDLIEKAQDTDSRPRGFVIAGMLRVPDSYNGIDEPEIQFAFFGDDQARELQAKFHELIQGQVAENEG